MTEPPVSRRERKKAATRQAIADAALQLFLERGYDHVGIRDIAETADVSTTTVFKHFTGKEALVFDQEESTDAHLIAAVRQRATGQSVLDALRQHVLDTWLPIAAHPQRQEFNHLVDSTPALRAYAERMWARHTDTLSAAIADEFGVDHGNLACAALARFALEVPVLAQGQKDRRAAVEEVFDILANGWQPPSRPTAPPSM
ncbi:TetR family transcriptional regulator [Streptomyces lunaelactis]|uniref:TetR/AcrR family transcriptional regulator n=1 Tax=Streptomyces lunaelactis TaxID=1535768 RepID=UPI0015845D34|nr:TetR/AcrR family transcriptional regulator [Streptomyces lunaelactis]NUK32820.1 TetR family transcriptional regulator [Streptomyces lunaelactis]NUK44340.1 TetR family transcriptional regulator [Streptomyces lunaelactis]NUK95807.1 TetR family transcriptional regulator [Streptomyces lunaelactis]NUL29714.1 TetR family transcriptional regulator [Streptomyces lunaelactis]